LLADTFHDQLPERYGSNGGDRWYAVVVNLVKQPNSSWWDNRMYKKRNKMRDLRLRSKLMKTIMIGIKANCLAGKKATFLRQKLEQISLVLITLAGVGLIQCRASTANTIRYTIGNYLKGTATFPEGGRRGIER